MSSYSSRSVSSTQATVEHIGGVSDAPDLAGVLLNWPVLDTERLYLFIKRLIDVAASVLLLIFLSPLFLVIAACIKVTSKGPVFFKQERIGQNWEPFLMYKFRTMSEDAERQETHIKRLSQGPFFKIKDDPRITEFGRFLRKYSLDELPQFMNVMIGNMSLVGPRPLLMIEFPHFQKPEHFRRFSMKPGLTCIWQVSGRNNTSDEQRLNYDLQYINSWSLALDFKLLLKTIPVVISGDGAY